MGATRKPRKRYVPRAVALDAADHAMALATKLRPGQRAELAGPLHRAFELARAGTGGSTAWCTLADGMNVAEQLAGRCGICSDRMPEIMAAQEALHTWHARHAQRGTWTLRADELRALDAGVLFHGIQLRYCTQGELRDAILAVQRHVQQALAGNASPRALVCIGALGRQQQQQTTPPGAPT